MEFRTSYAPTVEELRELAPYAVLDATGGVPAVPASIVGTDSPMVCTASDVISGKIAPVEESIVVVGSGMTGLETAELLSQREKDNAVLVLEAAPRLAPGVLGSNRNAITAVLEPNNVMLLVNRTLTRIGEDRIWFVDSQTGEEYVYPCDRVVLALGTKPANPYGEELNAVCDKVVSIGDRVHGGQIWDATRTGYRAALEL